MLAYAWRQNKCTKWFGALFSNDIVWQRRPRWSWWSPRLQITSAPHWAVEAWPELQFQSSQKAQKMQMLCALAQATKVQGCFYWYLWKPWNLQTKTFKKQECIISPSISLECSTFFQQMLLELFQSNLNRIQTREKNCSGRGLNYAVLSCPCAFQNPKELRTAKSLPSLLSCFTGLQFARLFFQSLNLGGSFRSYSNHSINFTVTRPSKLR